MGGWLGEWVGWRVGGVESGWCGEWVVVGKYYT